MAKATARKATMTYEIAEEMRLDIILNGGVVSEKFAEYDIDDMWEALENAPDSGFEVLNGNYWKPKESTNYNMTYEGLDSMTTKDGDVLCVKLKDKEGNRYIFSGKVAVKSLKGVEPPAFVRIKTGHKVKTAKGEYLNMEIIALPGTKFLPKPVETKATVVENDLPFE